MKTLQRTLIGAMFAVVIGTGIFVAVSGYSKMHNAGDRPGLTPTPVSSAARDFFLGPVIERVISRGDADTNRFVFISLKEGRIIKPDWPVSSRPGRGINFPAFTPELRQWIQTNDADVLLLLGDETWTLVSLGTLQAPTFASPLDQLDQLPPQRLASDMRALFDNLRREDGADRSPEWIAEWRAGYDDQTDLCELVRTRRGDWRVWNWAGMDGARAVKLRYRPVQWVSANLTFGPVIERVVHTEVWSQPIKGEDFDSCREIEVPAEIAAAGEGKVFHWLAANGVDLVASKHGRSWNLWVSSKLIPAPVFTWQQPAELALFAALSGRSPNYDGLPRAEPEAREGFISYRLDATVPVPVTSTFQTGAGGLGLLQFAGFTDNPNGLEFRYKVARPVRETLALR